MTKKTRRNCAKVAMAAVALTMAASMSASSLAVFARESSNSLVGAGHLYESDYNSFQEVIDADADLNVRLAAEGFVLLKNKNNALPLASSEKNLTVLGAAQTNVAYGGSGSGAQGTPGQTGVASAGPQVDLISGLEASGFKVNPRTMQRYRTGGTVLSGYVDVCHYMDKDNDAADGYVEFAGNKYKPAADGFLAPIESSFNVYDDAAVVIISRTGSEFSDNGAVNVAGHDDAKEHNQMLNYREKELLAYAKAHFDKVVVLLNSPSVMEIGDIESDEDIDAVLWIGQPGWNGSLAVGQILNGEVNPSGRTVDFWMKSIYTDPTSYNFGTYAIANGLLNDQWSDYRSGSMPMMLDKDGENNSTGEVAMDYAESIYLGYRYYETVAADMNAVEAGTGDAWYEANVLYPFGYGLSYTTFKKTIKSISKNSLTNADKDGTIKVVVEVENTGDVAGKEVVQIYSHAPYTPGGIEKAERDLVGFGKTSLLKPREKETVTVEFDVKELAAFDYNKANAGNHVGYELEAGNYEIQLTSNSHDVEATETITVGTQIDWDSSNEVNNIYSQDENGPAGYEEANTSANHWTVSGKDHYMTRARGAGETDEAADNLTVLQLASAVGDVLGKDATKKAAAQTLIKNKFAWMLSDDNRFKDSGLNAMKISRNNNAAVGYGGLLTETTGEGEAAQTKYYDRDLDNPLTKAIETDYKSVLTYKEAEDMEGLTQGAGVADEDTGLYALTLADMRGVAWEDEKWDTFLNQLTYNELFDTIKNAGYRLQSVGTVGGSMVGQPDGPGQLKGSSMNGYAWVCEVIVASTWNQELCEEQGRMVGEDGYWQMHNNGPVVGWYGPAMNCHRNPLSGRNFEYYSQDGVQGGLIAAAVSRGYVSRGGIISIKHSFLNNQETSRSGGATFSNEQALRLNDAKQFELAITKGGANGMMNAFNRIGLATSIHPVTSTALYVNEWGYHGFTVTDYYSAGATGWSWWSGVRGLTTPLNSTWAKSSTWHKATDGEAYTADGVYIKMGTGNNAPEKLSYTEWYWVRETAKHNFFTYCNSSALERGYLVNNTQSNGYRNQTSNVLGSTHNLGLSKSVNYSIFNATQSKGLQAIFGNCGYEVKIASGSSLPAGLRLSSDGILSGTPTAEGTTNVSVILQGRYGMAYNLRRITLTINVSATEIVATKGAAITATTAPAKPVTLISEGEDANYIPNFTGTSGDADSYGKYVSDAVWSLTGNVPEGITVNAETGVISGTPTADGVYNFNLVATYKVIGRTGSKNNYQYPVQDQVHIVTVYRMIVGQQFDITVNVNLPTGNSTLTYTANVGETVSSETLLEWVKTQVGESEVYTITGLTGVPEAGITEAVTIGVEYDMPYLVVAGGHLWLDGVNTGISVDGDDCVLNTVAPEDGLSISGATINDEGHLILTLTDGSTIDAGMAKGEQGEQGVPGDKGDKGDKGDTGAQGEKGSGCKSELGAGSLITIAGALAIVCAAVVVKKLVAKKED